MRRDLPPLRLLTTFEAVLRAGGVQNAAAELNVTQPAVSQALRSLEEHLGTRLLDRRMRPATLTDTGHVLFRAVSNGMDEIEKAVQQIRAIEAIDQNVVTVACTICTGTYWLMPRLATFYSQHPQVTVQVVTSNGVPHFSPETDLLIRYGSGGWSDGESELLFREKLVPVCSPQASQRFCDGDFEKAVLLDVESQDDCWPGWEDYLNMIGHPGNPQGRRSFDNYVQATQAAIAGMGVMLGWVSNTGDLISEGRLVLFRDQPLYPGEAFYLVTPLNKQMKSATRLLASHLQGCAAAP